MRFLPKKLDERFRRFHYYHASLDRLKRLMKYTRLGKPLPAPKLIFVEPTNTCNYKCLKCPHSSGLGREKATLDVELFHHLVEQLPHGTTLTLHHSGEPMLHPRIFDLIRIARDAGMKTVFFTNASLLHKDDFRITRDGPDGITFSIDGVSPDAYEKAHKGVSWDIISHNIEEVFKRLTSSSPLKWFQLILVKNNQTPEEIQDFLNFARKYPFNSVLVTGAFEWPKGEKVTPIPNFPNGCWEYPCWHPWLSPAILADGSVVACCLDAHGLYPAGNIKEKPFLEIFNGEKFDRMRRHLMDLEGTPPLALCDSCGVKRLAIPLSTNKRIAFHTLPLWKHLFHDLSKPIDA